jgi:hypothetical protein
VGHEQLAGHDSCFGVPDEPLSTRCGGQGVVIYFGMAKPVRAPQIGPRGHRHRCIAATQYDGEAGHQSQVGTIDERVGYGGKVGE